jgi:hypothetical protein
MSFHDNIAFPVSVHGNLTTGLLELYHDASKNRIVQYNRSNVSQKSCRNWRSLLSQSPPGNTTLRADVQRVPRSSHNPARQPSPGAALFSVAPHSLRITSCGAGGGGAIEEYTYLAQAFMETSENPILGTDLTSQAFKVGVYKFFTAKNTYKGRDSRAGHTFAIACALCSGVEANLRAILALPFVGGFAASSQVLQTSKCTTNAPRDWNLQARRRGGDALNGHHLAAIEVYFRFFFEFVRRDFLYSRG